MRKDEKTKKKICLLATLEAKPMELLEVVVLCSCVIHFIHLKVRAIFSEPVEICANEESRTTLARLYCSINRSKRS